MSVPRLSEGVLSPPPLMSSAGGQYGMLSPNKHSVSPPPVVPLSVPGAVSAVPVSPARHLSLSPHEEGIVERAGRVAALAHATTDATYHEELAGSRLAAARARKSVTEATAANLAQEAATNLQLSEKQLQAARSAQRAVDQAARRADDVRLKSLAAERELIDVDAQRLQEEARVARLQSLTEFTRTDVEHSHRALSASEAALHAAYDTVAHSHESLGALRRSVSSARRRKTKAGMSLQHSFHAVSQASDEVQRTSQQLVTASDREAAAALNHNAALTRGDLTAAQVHTIPTDYPWRHLEVEHAVADIETARLSQHVAERAVHEAYVHKQIASDRLMAAEGKLHSADAAARMSDAQFREAAAEMEMNAARLHVSAAQAEQAKLMERESKLLALRSKEQVILNAQKLARRRAVLKRATDKLKKLDQTAHVKQKEVVRQRTSSEIANRVFSARIGKEHALRQEADRAAILAQSAQATLAETRLGLEYATREEEEAARNHHLARRDTTLLRQEMEHEVQNLKHLESQSPLRNSYISYADPHIPVSPRGF